MEARTSSTYVLYQKLLLTTLLLLSLFLPRTTTAKDEIIANNLPPVYSPVITPDYEREASIQKDPAAGIVAYEAWLKARVKVSKQPAVQPCSCVLFAKAKLGMTQSIGAARNWPKNTSVPQVGGVVITNESAYGHVAIITAVTDTDISVIEANYQRCKVSTRTISRTSPIIKGYFYGNN